MKNWKRKFQCLQRKNYTSILCCANAIRIWKNPSGRNFCSVTTVSGSAWRKNRRRSRIKTSPRCRRRIRRWTVISRKMPGRKRLMQRRLEKPIQRKTSGKNMQSVSKAIWKPMQKTRRQMRESLHGC